MPPPCVHYMFCPLFYLYPFITKCHATPTFILLTTTIGQSGIAPQPGLTRGRRDGAVESQHTVNQHSATATSLYHLKAND